jgi:carboxyl-terminal processing protease
MMRDAHDEVKKHYYDPKLQGLDWDARLKTYSDRVSTAQDLGQGFRDVAAYLSGLKDSHTFFIPPTRRNRYETGYRYSLVGDNCFITRIRPGTDAALKLHVGDQVLSMNGFKVNRGDFEAASYFFNRLAPQPAMQLDVRSPDGADRSELIKVSVIQGKQVLDMTQGSDYWDLVRRDENEDHVSREEATVVDDVMIWKFPEFFFDGGEIDRFIGQARKHKALILDLRGDGGGSTDTLEWLIGGLFDHDVKIADRVGRKPLKPLVAKRHGQSFDGKLIVLVDSESASAAELLARVVQLEHRGTVVGDNSAGAVMEAKWYQDSQGVDTKFFYGFSVTEADLLMSDGKSLEKVGVTPDEIVLPSAADLAAGRDPALARAAELAGIKLDSATAGKMFPFEWLPL